MSPAALHHFFDDLECVSEWLSIQQTDVWNMDEHGLQIGHQNAHNVIAPTDQALQLVSPETREWISIIESVSAGGTSTRPVIIFKGQNIQTTWFPGTPEVPDWPYVASPKGWTSDEISLKWFQSVFLPDTTPSNPDAWRILICDGHSSHT